jgi:hypothetical protein
MTLINDQAPKVEVRARRGWITPVLATIGAIAIIVVVGSAVLHGVWVVLGGETTKTVSVAGVDALDIRASAAEFRVEFGNVTEAELHVTGSSDWTLERDGSTLMVRPQERWFGSWFGADEKAVLTLPDQLRKAELDANFSISAGIFIAEGDFDDLWIGMSAGIAHIDGVARTVSVRVSSAHAQISLSNVSVASFHANAGNLIATLSGSVPQEIEARASVGKIDLSVPDAPYAVTSNVSAGSFEPSVVHDPQSTNRISVNVSAGEVIVRPGR